jgi:hypothetical protein
VLMLSAATHQGVDEALRLLQTAITEARGG